MKDAALVSLIYLSCILGSIMFVLPAIIVIYIMSPRKEVAFIMLGVYLATVVILIIRCIIRQLKLYVKKNTENIGN